MALTLVVNGLLAAWVLLRPVTGPALVNVDYLLQSLGGILGGVFCFLPLRRPRPSLPRPALLCGLSVFAYAVGQMYMTGYRLAHGADAPTPSPADAFDLLSYPLLLAGLLSLPARRLPPAARPRITLDGLMIMTAAVTFSWRFILGPFCLASHQSLATQAVNIGYPVGDLILLLCLLRATAGSARPDGRRALSLLAFGLLVVMAADSTETYELLHGGYVSGTLLDVGWSLGYMPIGLAVASLCRQEADEAERMEAGRPPPVWLSLLPYALLPAVALLVWGTRRLPGPPILERGVWLGALLLVGLVLARQVLSILENGQLNGSLQSAYADLAAGEARYRQMFEASPHPMWVYSVESLALIDVNEAAVQSYGYTRAEFLSMTLGDLRPPEDRALLRAALAEQGARRTYRNDGIRRHQTKSGRIIDVEVTSNALPFDGVPARIVLVQDITERRQLEADQEWLLAQTEDLLSEAVDRADRDPLTGLWNHRAFHRRLEEESDRAEREGGSLAVVMLDLDDFKFFNDSYGHAAGDDVLRQVADALCGACRSYDTLARFGGDEFSLLMPLARPADASTPDLVRDAVEEIYARLSESLSGLTFLPPGQDSPLPLAVSFGVALFPQEAPRSGVLPLADERLFRSKGGGEEDDEAQRLRRHLLSSAEGYSMLDALLVAVDNKDRYTRRHSEDVLAYSVQIARGLGLSADQQQRVAVAALLHDVGKIGVPNAVLRKPGKLTGEEFEAIQQHPLMGAVIVGAVPGFEDTLDAIRHHHERWDGAGYPGGLRGEDTPLPARLMAVADAFSAMTTDRPYRKGMDEGRALAILKSGAGTQWDPVCVQVFLSARYEAGPASAEGPARLSRPTAA